MLPRLNLNKLSIKHIKLLNHISDEIKTDFHILLDELYESIEFLINEFIEEYTKANKL